MSFKIDKLKLGLLFGIIAPVVTMILVYFISFSHHTFDELIDLMVSKRVFTKIISLCVIPNLALFFLFLNKNYYQAARGVLLATILFACFVFMITFVL